MKTMILLLLVVASNSLAFCQDIVSDQSVLDSIFEPKLTGEAYLAKSGLVGTQFFNDEWIESDLFLKNGETVFNKLLRYNGFIDEVIWLTPENFKQVKLDKFAIDKFVLKNYRGKKVCFKQINTKQAFVGDSTDIFAEVAIEGKLSLYIFRKIGITGSINQENKGGSYTYELIEPSPKYYLKQSNNRFIALSRLNRRAFLKLFPEQKSAIRKMLRQNHQSLATEFDLLKIVNLLNTNNIN